MEGHSRVLGAGVRRSFATGMTSTLRHRTATCSGACWRRPRGALATLTGAHTRAFQVIKKGHDRQKESLYEKLGFGGDSEAERVQRRPEELLQGFVQEAMKLKDPEHDPKDAARMEEMKTAYRLLQNPVFRANYGSHYYASNDAQLHVLQDGGQVGANHNPEHQTFSFVDHASGRSLAGGDGTDHAAAGPGGDDAARSVGDFRNAFRQATGASDAREARAHNAAEAAGPLGGGDIHFTLRLSFQEALHGCTKRIRLLKHTKCRRCQGTGTQRLSKPRACPQCLGRGSVNLPSSTYHIERRCNYCGGDGHMPPPRCATCAGRGVQLDQEVELPVTVPAHTRNLSVFPMNGLGHDGVRGGGPGSLILTAMVQEHRHLYQNTDGTLHAVLPVLLSTALLGGLVPAPAVRDENTGVVPMLRVPPYVRNGQVLSLWEYGVAPNTTVNGAATPHNREHSHALFPQDVQFHVLVMTPRGTNLSGRQLEALGQFQTAAASADQAQEEADETAPHGESTLAQYADLKKRYRHWLPQQQ